MRRLLREPLLHFLVLGAMLFAVYGWLHRGVLGEPKEIVVTQGQLEALDAQFRTIWQRPPSADELKGLIDNWVQEEVFYREGLSLGLDRDDSVVRRRVAQKLEFLADGQEPATPTEAELQAWLLQHPSDYQIEASYTLRQVYFDPARHGDRFDADISAARLALGKGKAVNGDATMLPPTMHSARDSEVSRTFGAEFSEGLRALKVGEWSEPIRSGFGVHLVMLTARDAGRPATLAEARQAVERDLLHARTEEAKQAFYAKARALYTVRVDGLDASGNAAKAP